jgi:predicted TIM-barrel fold metal-dependent hydrolase
MHRRDFLASTAAGAVAGGISNLLAADDQSNLEIIDCHAHFYDPSRPEGVPWPPKGSFLDRTVLPRHLREQKQYRPVTGTVVVEASVRVEDNAWLLEIARDDPFIVGIVGRLHPGQPGFGSNLKRFTQNPLFRGIRVQAQLLKTLLQQNNLNDLKRLADNDLSLDVNAPPELLPVASQLAEALPDLRIVLNHIGNVRITRDGPGEDWKANITALAAHPNAFSKLSALVEGAARPGEKAPTDLDFYRPYIDVVWNAFGNGRMIYGSNWPVCERAADYYTVERLALEYAAEKGPDVLRDFCAGNAGRAYKWIDRPGRRSPKR